MNFVEHLPTALALMAIGGLSQPVVQASFGLVMIIARVLFTIGYARGGPQGRMFGAILWDIGLVASMVLACMSSINLIMDK